jgi:hypothetical protein
MPAAVGSGVIDQGTTFSNFIDGILWPGCLSRDARGERRPKAFGCDIGAIERVPDPIP